MEWHFSKLFFLGVSQNTYGPQLTPICIGFLENMDNSWYRYFFDRVYKKLVAYER